MLEREPRFVTVTMRYKKRKPNVLLLFSVLGKPCIFCILSSMLPSNHICQLSISGYLAIPVSKIAMKRVLENEFRVVTGRKNLPG
jgi:hypothetical protein